ncbi:uncharacterized protein SETTUDRAFT_168779 [Exserohilum turcica Et28A]
MLDEESIAFICIIRGNINQLTANNVRQAKQLERQAIKLLTRRLQEARTTPPPTGAHVSAINTTNQTSEATAPAPPVRSYPKPRLPNAKLFADGAAYLSKELKTYYIITRTKGRAFNALYAYVQALINSTLTATTAGL